MTVALMSLFRNSEHRLRKYFQQVLSLRAELKQRGDDLELICVYGDCTDNTEGTLRNFANKHKFDISLIEANHGGPFFGSTEEPARMKALSFVLNEGLSAFAPQEIIDGVRFIPCQAKAVIYVESDLTWDASSWVNLLGDLEPGYDVIAPLIFAGEYFYDIWGFRSLTGERWTSRWKGSDGNLIEVGSVGSGFVMRGDVARTCRVQNDNAIVGLMDDVRAHGYRIWVDPTERITHPA